MTTMSLRLDDEEKKKIDKLMKTLKQDRSFAARKLIQEGWEMHWIKAYCRGYISLGKLSEYLNQSLTEVIDLLSELGIQSPLEYSDYLEGFKTIK